ncbi:hypothetical protein [Streptomyces calidiresistens]|uniref:Uncharacterized protein n=1 Tax=Streptomyces calidiresistens TaxID=1485586 RepID=A0A7W3T3I9_9ACTN|nr:hypothetical protein [Streptomyces calidiresistens]MBB0230275.1 hypothetical protein [Streptomyces calidiresistens]
MIAVTGTFRRAVRASAVPAGPGRAPLLLVSRRHIDYCRCRSAACSRG